MMNGEGRRWAVIGGGLLGMTLAYRLARAGQRVTLLEQADRLGGLAQPWELGDVTWDRHYHVTLLSDTVLRGLLEELGLERELRWKETKTGFYVDGRLYSMSNMIEFLQFPPLNLLEKFRLGTTIAAASKRTNWRPLERICVEDWLVRWSGRGTFEKIWRPLLRAKLGDNYKRTSAAFIWATIARMYAARHSGMKKEMFGYVPGGYDSVLAKFSDRLVEEGVDIRLNCSTRCITWDESDGATVEFGEGERESFDRAVLTVPAPLVGRLLPGLSQGERDRWERVDYQGIVCASLLLKKPLASYYVTNITDAWVPFTAVIEMSALVDRAQFNGHSLVYLPKYVDSGNDKAFATTDEALRERFVGALERMYPHFCSDDVVAFRVSRVRNVMPLPTLDYSRHLPPKRTSMPGIFAISSAHITNSTLNANQTIRLAEESFAQILAPECSTDIGSLPTGTHNRKPIASLSLDLDNKWTYLKTHGDPNWESFPSYLDLVVPRALEMLTIEDLRATFFIVGQDAALEKNREAIAAIAAAGHEIGNHSFRHEPWLHLYSREELESEFDAAEEAIEQATNRRPTGFRGPGYSHSEETLRQLAIRGYEYDASTLPTFLGPVARAYYFLTARLNREQKRQRKQLFGKLREGFRELRPHILQVESRKMVEIPVTTMPITRTPFHVSYLLYLAQFSRPLALAYFRLALSLCRMRNVPPSLLLHPLDFLGAEDEKDLSFFPAMRMPTAAKFEFVREVLQIFRDQFHVVTMREHCHDVLNQPACREQPKVADRDALVTS